MRRDLGEYFVDQEMMDDVDGKGVCGMILKKEHYNLFRHYFTLLKIRVV